MPITDYSQDPAENTLVGGKFIGEGSQRKDMNDAVQLIMADLRSYYDQQGALPTNPQTSTPTPTTDGDQAPVSVYHVPFPPNQGIMSYIEGMHFSVKLHATNAENPRMKFGSAPEFPLQMAGSGETLPVPERFLQKDEVLDVVFSAGVFFVKGARLQTDAESVADEGYLRELDFTDPTLDALRDKVDMTTRVDLENTPTDGFRYLLVKHVSPFAPPDKITFPTAPILKKARFRCIFERRGGQSVSISLPFGTARFGFKMDGDQASFFTGGIAGSSVSVDNDGIYVLEVAFNPDGARLVATAKMGRWKPDTPLDRVFGANGGYKPLSPTHRDETQTNNRVNIQAVGEHAGLASVQTSGGGAIEFSLEGDTQVQGVKLYHVSVLVGDARKIGIHYGGSGGGSGDFDDSELVASIEATQAFAASKGIRRWTRDAGDPNQYGELDMVLNDGNVYYAKRTHAGGVDFSLDNWALIDGTAIDHLATQDALDASRIKDWVVNTQYAMFDLVRNDEKIYYYSKPAEQLPNPTIFSPTEWTLIGATDAGDISYGQGSVADFLNAEPELHGDAVSTTTFNTTTGTSTQEKLDGKVDKTEYDPAIAGKATKGYVDDELALKQDKTEVRTDGAVRALAEAQITAEILPNGKIADAIEGAVDAIVLPTPRTDAEIDTRADSRIEAGVADGGIIDTAIKAIDIPQEGLNQEQVDARVKAGITPLSPSVLQSHADTKPAQRPMTSFVATHANSPLSTTPFVITTSDLAGIADGEVIKVEFPFFFDAQAFRGFAPDCGLVITQDGNPIKTYDAENGTGLLPQGTNQISFFGVKGGDITVQPIVKLNTTPDFEGDTSLDITFFPYTGGFDFFQLGVLHDEAVRLIQAQIAIESAKQALINNRVEGAVDGLQNILNVLQASFQQMQARLENPAYAVLDRAVVEAAEVGETIARTDRGIAFNAVLETGGSPYMPVIVFDLVSGGISPSNVASLNFAEVRDDNGVWVNVLSPQQPARTEAGVVRSGNAIVDEANPLRINLGLGGHHQDSTITLTPDPDNLPIAGAIFNVDFHAVVGGNNRAFFEMNIPWGSGAVQTQVATSENGETVSVVAQQVGNAVRVRITETGAESLPIAGGYLSLWAHYDIAIPIVPAGADWQRIGDHNGHFVMLLETGAGASSASRPVVIHYGNGQKIATNRPAGYIEFYTNNDTNIGNIYSVDLADTYDLTPLQASAEAGDDTLGFFAAPVLHYTSELDLDTGLIITDKTEKKRNVIEELDAMAGGGVAKGEFGDFLETTYPSFDVDVSGVSTIISHELIHDCEIRGARIEVLEALTFTGDIVGVHPILDGTPFAASNYALSKVGDSKTYYANVGGKFIDSSTDINIASCDSNGENPNLGSASGRIRLILICQRMTK